MSRVLSWTSILPVVAIVVLALGWGKTLPPIAIGVVTALLAGTVLAAVHHAEVVAHRVGEPTFAAIAAFALYGLFVALQTGRHRDYFLWSRLNAYRAAGADVHRHSADRRSGRATLLRAGVHLALLAAYLFLAVNP